MLYYIYNQKTKSRAGLKRRKEKIMIEYIYKDGEKYWRELTDLTGKSLNKEEISEAEYMSYKQ